MRTVGMVRTARTVGTVGQSGRSEQSGQSGQSGRVRNMQPRGWWPAYAGRVGGVLHKFSVKLTLTPARQVEFLPRAGHLAVPAPPWARLGTLAVDSPAARLSTHMAGSRPPPDGVEPRGRVSQWPRSRGFIFVREGGDSLLCAMVGGLSAVRSPTTPSRRNMKRACTFEGAMGMVGSSCPALPWGRCLRVVSELRDFF